MSVNTQDLYLALVKAVETNNVTTVIDLIKKGVDVNKRGPLPLTPLMIAAGRGYVQMTQTLLDAGADVNVIDSVTGASPLHKAAQSGVVEVARILLKHGAFLNLQSAIVGHTPLIDAVWSKKPPMVKFLLDQGAIINIKGHHGADVWEFASNEETWTAGFTVPGQESWGKSIRQMLEERQKTDEAAQKQPLMQAVSDGNLAAVKSLIAQGVDVNESSPIVGGGNDGQTPLLVACFLGHKEIVLELLKAGASPHIVDYLMKATPAHKGAYAGRPEAVKALIENSKVDLLAQGPYNGYTALHDATWHGHTEVVKVLLNANVPLNLQGHDGKTPLDLAIEYGYKDIEALIRMKMQFPDTPLKGKKVAVLVETEYIPDEIEYYKNGFPALGAEVDFLSYLWGKESRTIVSDIDNPDKQLHKMVVTKDVANYDPNNYDIVLMAANYCAIRLREIPPMGNIGSPEELQRPPAVQFYKKAMANKRIIKGALCHGLWILTPCPEVLKGRKVICHTVVLADIVNAGATFVPDKGYVVVDNDLVTARSAANLKEYFNKIVELATKGISPNCEYQRLL
ncbi:MAG: ankyrin repeat domain-containing protein [Dolichospermum sp.]